MLGDVLTAIVTPFRSDGSVDRDRFRALARYLVENGSDGIVVAGTTGESPTLTDEERLDLFRLAVEEVGDEATVVAGTGTYSTAHSIHLTEAADELGADAMLVVAPYYSKPQPAGVVAHVEAIAEATDKPIVVYNIPSRVVINIEPETFARLAEIPNVTAVKQAHDDLAEARRIVDLGLDLYAGDDPLLLPFLRLGGVGVVSVTAHLVGARMKEMVEAVRAGDDERAARIDEELRPAWDLLKVVVNPVAIKAALNLLGHDVGGHRLPLVAATGEETARIRTLLERQGLLVAA